MMSRKNLTKHNSIDAVDPYLVAWLAKLGIKPNLYDKKACYSSQQESFVWIGEISDDLPQGPGVLLNFSPKRVISLVSFQKGLREGESTVYYEDGSSFKALYRRDVMEGTTELIGPDKKQILKATFNEGFQAEIVYSNGQMYLGEHFYLYRNGPGRLYADKSRSVDALVNNGTWEANKFVKGFAKLDFYVGEVHNGVYQGQGTLYFDKERTKRKFAGYFHEGLYHGIGSEFYEGPTEDLKYNGMFEKGLYNGEGVLKFYENGVSVTFKGNFTKGQPAESVAICDKSGRIQKKVNFEDGKVRSIVEEYFYDFQVPCIRDISPEEVKSGQIDKINIKMAVYNYKQGTIKYFREFDDIPVFLVQVEKEKFEKNKEGVLSEGGTLVYVGPMTKIFFEGKGCLRYNVKGEPKKYDGEFKNSLFNGKGNLHYASGKQLYCGEFLNNSFNGKGVLTIHLLRLVNDFPMQSNQILPSQNPLEEYNLEIDGTFKDGKFQGGVWRFSGLSTRVSGRVFTLSAQTTEDSLIGKLFEDKRLVYEGRFDKFLFDGKGTLFYKGSSQKKYVGDFKEGRFHGKGELYKENGDLLYSGDFINGIYEGVGKLFDGLKGPVYYEGEFQNGNINGNGKICEKATQKVRSQGQFTEGVLIEGLTRNYDENNNLVYDGKVLDGLYEGEGTVFTAKGEVALQGMFRKSVLVDGKKKEFFNNGVLYKEGTVIEGQYEGSGKEYFFDGKVFYDGDYKNNEKHGQGTVYHRNGKIKQKGAFKDGVFMEGETLLYFEDSQVVRFQGFVKDASFEGPGKRFYQDGTLEYEGSFAKGYFEGNGTYYYPDGKVKFRGLFANGVPNGEGEFFAPNGKLIYKGGMIDWKKDGNGILYSKEGEKLQEGVFKDDEFFKGIGKQYWPGYGTLKYEGEYDNGFIEGKGKLYFTNGNLEYEGMFKAGKFAGQGVLYSEQKKGMKVYEGGFFKGQFGGQGVLYGKEETYTGEFRFGKKHGQGCLRYNDNSLGVKFEGNFQHDIFEEGLAYLRDSNGKLYYVGNVKLEKYHGKGKLYHQNGEIAYEGVWENGVYHGEGAIYNSRGELEYEGNFDHGVYSGKGKLYRLTDPKRLIYEGEFKNREYEGEGTLYDENGKILYKGGFKEGIYCGTGTLYFKGSEGKVKYAGQFNNGEFEGFGEKNSKKGYKKYTGRFKNGKFDGEGMLFYPNGVKKFVGTFKMKVYHKDGILSDEYGNPIYKGGYKDGKYHGNGILYYTTSPNKVYYEGEFVDGVMQGKGTFRYENGVVKYAGGVKNGTYEGKGILYLEQGIVLCESTFTNGDCEHGMHHA